MVGSALKAMPELSSSCSTSRVRRAKHCAALMECQSPWSAMPFTAWTPKPSATYDLASLTVSAPLVVPASVFGCLQNRKVVHTPNFNGSGPLILPNHPMAADYKQQYGSPRCLGVTCEK